MKLTLELIDTRDQVITSYHGAPKTDPEYTRAKVDAEATDAAVIAGHLRSIADAIDPKPTPQQPAPFCERNPT